MIFVKYSGGLGNNLFQWAFARVLSKLSGIPMMSPPIPLFPITETCSLDKIPKGIQCVLPANSYYANLDEWVNKARNGNILVKGCPHNTKFFEPSKKWLSQELVPLDGDYATANVQDIVVHVRLGDYFSSYWIAKFGYPTDVFARLLKTLDYKHCYIVTDSPSSPIITDLIQNHRGILVAKSPEHDYRTMFHAARLVMSPSTFCWWAAWTGHGKEIYQPYEFSFWRRELQFALDLTGANVKRFDATGRIL